jgi:hypothetical protein
MAYLPGFNHDIFISYAHVNNPAGESGADGWVTQFHHKLEAELKQLVGKELDIWRDSKLGGNDLFDQRIERAVKEAGLFVSLNSFAYMKSPYCQQELECFWQKAKTDGWGLSIGDHSRLINILLNNIPFAEWHPALSGASGYQFYEDEPDADILFPYDPDSDEFRNEIRNLARDLLRTLREFADAIQSKQPTQAGVDSRPAPEPITPVSSDGKEKPNGSSRFGIISKAALVVACVAMLVVVLLVSIPKTPPKPELCAEEGTDSLNENLPQWTPQGLGWNVGRIGEAYGRLIKGNQVGLFKTAQTNTEFNHYQDFTLELDVRFTGRKGVAWVVRAQDFNNYYLFKLVKSVSGLSPADLYFYKCEQGAIKLIDTARAQVDVEDDQDNFLITTEVNGSKFGISIRKALSNDPGPHTLSAFTNETFAYGGIGLLPQDGKEVLLQQLRIEPHSRTNQNKEPKP